MRKGFLGALRRGASAAAVLTAAAGVAWGAHPADVLLRDASGLALTASSREPYSPKATCGSCHDYDKIAGSYHVQQGWNELRTAAQKEASPWAQSPGMAGKW